MQLNLSDPSSIRSFYACPKRTAQVAPSDDDCVQRRHFSMGANEFVTWGSRRVEKTFAVNHLGHFYLIHTFAPTLKGERGARVVVVSVVRTRSSSNRRHAKRSQYYAASRDARQKCLLALCPRTDRPKGVMYCSQRALHAARDSFSSIGPALITTGISKRKTRLHFLHHYVAGNFTMNADQGAATTVYACLLPSESCRSAYRDVSSKNRESDKGVKRLNEDAALWSVSERIVLESQ